MQTELVRALPVVIILMPFLLLSAKERQATIEDTGSTNRVGLRVTFDETGHATVESRSGDTRQVDLEEPNAALLLGERRVRSLWRRGGARLA
jgi:hypothetical protein